MYHNFRVDIAEKYGVSSAIILNNLHFWITKNRANKKHFYKGRYWTYNSQEAFTKLFPYWTRRQVQTRIKRLEKQGLIIRDNFNKVNYDRTTWYSLTDKALNILEQPIEQPCSMEDTNSFNGKHKDVQPIPDINTDKNTDTTTNNSGGGSFQEVIKFYEVNGFGLINLYTKEDLVDLCETYSSEWVLDAMKIAVDNNKRNPGYVKAILKRWRAEGKGTKKKNKVRGWSLDDYEEF